MNFYLVHIIIAIWIGFGTLDQLDSLNIAIL